ncbi:putative translation factor protein [Phaeoacremonium minimum UCRPA7]|uniref:Protein DOM34 homolog n=1 Tax=Phaeoacremonium minimum (strain UCR-PA7) TaxID=1286976 RepID=R8BU27_PHAM7|nr:putative translation factor protein [Phaeoacremonium minimum UCRPA7]EOO02882.1 putative translation factor protein [Phaeoacremonium minimum UCRPA7]
MLLVGAKKSQRLEEIGEDSVSLLPTEPEDMWHANNLISPEDILRAHAIRKVTKESSTGSTSTERVHTELTIRVTSTFFDPAASSLHVSGRVVSENAFVSAGQYHTLDLELNRPFTLWKKYGWDSVALETLRDALNQDKDGAVAAVVMHEGLANICLITEFQTLLKQRVESSVPKKRSAASDQDSGMRRFFDKTLSTLLRAVDFSKPRPLLLASPGFVAADFKKYIADEAARLADKRLASLAKDAVVTHSSSGHLHSLNEVLKNPEVLALMKDKKSASETKYMDEFFDRLRKDDGRAWYGVQPVEKAVLEGAVGRGGGVLLVNNNLFRSLDIATRKRYVALVDKVKENGGEARILSSDHESGQRLEALGGIAAILTYPILDLDEDAEEEQDEEADGQAGDTAVI